MVPRVSPAHPQLLEQALSQVVEVLTPGFPAVAARDFVVFILHAGLVEHLAAVLAVLVGDVGGTALCEGEDAPGAVDLVGMLEHSQALGLLPEVAAWFEAGAEHPHVVEHVDVLQAGLEGLHAAH